MPEPYVTVERRAAGMAPVRLEGLVPEFEAFGAVLEAEGNAHGRRSFLEHGPARATLAGR